MTRTSTLPQPTFPVNYNLEEHYTLLAERQNLAEFSGEIPPRKKRKLNESSEAGSTATTKEKVRDKKSLFYFKKSKCDA